MNNKELVNKVLKFWLKVTSDFDSKQLKKDIEKNLSNIDGIDHEIDYIRIEFDYINESPYKTYSRKIIADVYIDDAVLGGITDWDKIEELFERAKKHE